MTRSVGIHGEKLAGSNKEGGKSSGEKKIRSMQESRSKLMAILGGVGLVRKSHVERLTNLEKEGWKVTSRALN